MPLEPPRELLVTDPNAAGILGQLMADRNRFAVAALRPDFDRTPPAMIADRLRLSSPGTGDDRRPLDSWLVMAAPTSDEPLSPDTWRGRLKPWNSQRLVVLLVGLPPDNAGWRGWVFQAGEVDPLAGFRIVAGGMPEAGGIDTYDAASDPKWSRTVKAVGETAFNKASRASVAVIGASRLGSAVAFQLAGVGVRRITLVDPDVLEPHNIVGSVGLRAEDSGEKKVLALARSLIAFRPDLAVTAVPYDFLDRRAKLHGADLIVSAVDRDAGRLAASHWARRHGAVHLDIGTGVTRQGIDRLLAADVRLFLPGAGCVRCVGGLGDLDQAEYELRAPPGAAPRRPPEKWDARGRLGSLPTLNALAASTGVQLWLDLLTCDLGGSAWHRVRWVPGKGLELAVARVTAGAECVACRRKNVA
ncbi:MAG: ThiF family adenylyltransferase [Gemmataceae bacterium]|nr:ThiF family adenylyltransferase [Gemmataceae bacterium]